MSLSLGGLLSTPAKYDVDDACPGIVPRLYLNDQLNDCVIAARAHHSVRLTYSLGSSLLNISDDEVSNEYHLEAGTFDVGIVLSVSLSRWMNHGWIAGGVSRSIDSFKGPLSITGAGMLSGDATTDLTISQLQSCIIENTGVQVDLNLPEGISVNDGSTFGPNADWTDTSKDQSRSNRHVMLLTGYDPAGVIGITWGARQHMSWAFLEKYYTGIYWVTKNSST